MYRLCNKNIVKRKLVDKGWVSIGNTDTLHNGEFEIVVSHFGDCDLFYDDVHIESVMVNENLDVDEVLKSFRLSTLTLAETLKDLAEEFL
jgi:hypothetical protein